MTWDELKEEAKKLGCFIYEGKQYTQYIVVQSNGDTGCDPIQLDEEGDVWLLEDYLLCEKRTPEQMYEIMKAVLL